MMSFPKTYGERITGGFGKYSERYYRRNKLEYIQEYHVG